jgi:hypothetical protein
MGSRDNARRCKSRLPAAWRGMALLLKDAHFPMPQNPLPTTTSLQSIPMGTWAGSNHMPVPPPVAAITTPPAVPQASPPYARSTTFSRTCLPRLRLICARRARIDALTSGVSVRVAGRDSRSCELPAPEALPAGMASPPNRPEVIFNGRYRASHGSALRPLAAPTFAVRGGRAWACRARLRVMVLTASAHERLRSRLDRVPL